MKRVGARPLDRLAWAVDFSQRELLTPGDQLNAELELTCFQYALNLAPDQGVAVSTQIKALMTVDPWKEDSFQGSEVTQAQKRFRRVLQAAAGETEVGLLLKHVKVEFTRAEGVQYVSTIPHRRGQSATELSEAKLEAAVFKLLRLLDKTVRTSVAKAKGGERFTPLRMYVGLCPEARDGCGKLFSKKRIDQDYCSRTCVSRAQVYRFRANQWALKQLYPGKRMKELTASECANVEQRAKAFAFKKHTP
jgi:hypothetical protein